MILDSEYIKTLTQLEAEKLLAEYSSNPLIYLPLMSNPQIMHQVDGLANTICWLEDHIKRLVELETLKKAQAARWADVAAE